MTPPENVAAFLDKHWQSPLAHQGVAPAHFTPQEAALDPASCGACHVQQFEDWRGALQKLPTWLGPPCSFSSRFQSIQPTVQRLRSLMIERP